MQTKLHAQPGILAPCPPAGRFVTFDLVSPIQAGDAVERLRTWEVDEAAVIGVGPALAAALGHRVPGLAPFTARTAPGVSVPSTGGALWAYVRGDSADSALQTALRLRALLGDAVTIQEDVATFVHAGGRDLTGYEDGTENPKGDGAVATAIVSGVGDGLDGGSFASTQRWVHDLAAFRRWPKQERDNAIGREQESNDELPDAPETAHVKRTAQESYAPAAFMVRRSMPWGDTSSQGLYFVAYGHSLHAFERMMARMSGEEDGVVDALFRFSRPVTGATWWCPPVRDGRLDLRALGA